MAKTSSLNFRISREFRDDLEALAEYHGLSLSSYVHSLLVRTVRREKEGTPEAFTKPIPNKLKGGTIYQPIRTGKGRPTLNMKAGSNKQKKAR